MATLEVAEDGPKTQKINNFYDWNAPSSVGLKEREIQIRAGANNTQLKGDRHVFIGSIDSPTKGLKLVFVYFPPQHFWN